MARLTAGDITLSGKFALESILELELTAKANEHAALRYKGMVDRDTGLSLLERRVDGEMVTLLLEGYPTFTGVIRTVELMEENDLFYLTVSCQDYSCLLDENPTSRFFQNTNMTYGEILTQLFADAEDASIVTIQGDNAIGVPILQYGETDWQFALRMAGKLETVIIPNLTAHHSQIAIGVPTGHRFTYEGNDYVINRHSSIRPGQWKAENMAYTEFLSYEIEDDRVFRLGDKVTINGNEMAVMEMSLCYTGRTFRNCYTLGHERGFASAYRENPKQAGLMLPGRVLSVAGEQVKVELEIFDQCDPKTATDFGYAPQSNSGMYCMPEVGTKVMLKWQGSQDGDILAAHTVRENGQECAELGNPQDRYLTTADGKRLAMLPELLYFRGEGNNVKLVDASGIQAKTKKQLELRADGVIFIGAGNRVEFQTPEQLRMAKTGVNSGINVVGGQMHMKSEIVRIQGDQSKPMTSTVLPPRQESITMSTKLAASAAAMIPQVGNVKFLEK